MRKSTRRIGRKIAQGFGMQQCSGKRRYTTKAEACAVKRVEQKRAEKELKVYECRVCRWWHLASNE